MHLDHLIKRQIDMDIFCKLIGQINLPGGIQGCVKTQIINDFDRADSNYLELKYSEI